MRPISHEDANIEQYSEQEREKWDRKIEFTFSCVGFAVGYGNFWRFPFKCLKNGGGAFLLPFIICMALIGIPLFLLEASIGQLTQSGPVRAWRKLCPLASGIGVSMMLVSFFCSVYYNVILAWSIYYLYNSFKSDIPWVGCSHSWNTKSCFSELSNFTSITNHTRPSPSREFFIYNVLRLSSGIDNLGFLHWKIAACLLFSWIVVYFCIWKGIRTTGKVVYVTAAMPYLIMLIFFMNGLMLDGSMDGIRYYINPKWDRLLDLGVWIDAASQVFFSIAIGFGVMLTFASYNPKHNNVCRDALVVSLADAMTSIFSGFVVFSILGYMAAFQGKDITDPSIAIDGPGLVFIVYPAALATLPQPHVWSVIFFLMLITLGLDSQFGQVELVCTCIIEQFPRQLKCRKEIVMLITCIIMFLLGLPCVTEGGMYVFHLLDSYAAGTSILFLGIAEAVAIGWLYGNERFLEDICMMTRRPVLIIWGLMWKYVTPVITIAILLANLIHNRRLTYGSSYQYPLWADVLGWLIVVSIILCVPALAIKTICCAEGDLRTRVKLSMQPQINFQTYEMWPLQEIQAHDMRTDLNT